MDCAQIDLYEFLTEAELQHYYNAVKNELKITNASQFKYATDEDLKSISMSRPEIRRLRKFYEKHFPHGYLSKIKRLLQAPTAIVKRDESSGSGAGGSTGTLGNASSTPGNLNSSSGAINKNNSSPSKAPNNKHIIPADAISVNKKLGTGEFGIVQQGVWTNGTERIQVAIKCLCRERMQSNPMEFLKEAAIMHSIEHENIVRLYGVVLATDSLMLVTELAHLRSLFECLKDAGLRVSFLTVPTLCEFALQICNGMRYLENKRLIHRDLAARNILVFSKNKVKISDFGLSRALGVGKDYYKTNFNVNLKLPIAWCAPECINYLRFTNASDVWAYGVCLWEMFSYGFQPWAALTGLQILEAIDAPNYQRLEQPECCPREHYNLMMKCWQDDPSKRPKFNEIYEMLPEMKPEQLKAVDNCLESKTKDHLIYRQNDIITVLDRNTGTPFWKGVLNSGKTGLFNPSNTVAYVEGLPTLNRESFSRSTSDRASSKRKLRTEMISKPQNDFKHTGHVGIDGASFGDIAFLGSSQNYNHVPRQIVTPYKPSEDIEQTPLLLPPTPTSPDSLQTASGYFADDSQHSTSTMNPSFIPSTENTPKNFTNTNRQSNTFEFPTDHTNTNTNPFSMHKAGEDNANMTMALQNNNYGVENKEQLSWRQSLTGANRQSESFDEPHQYHEISDDDEMTPDKLDFGPSLLDEINSMFGSMTATTSTTLTTTITHNKNAEIDNSNTNTNTHNKRGDFSDLTSKLIRKNSAGATKKSKNSCGVVKPISVKDERILNQAIEIANEISARSMCSLVSDQPPPSTQSPKRKFSFRFPHLSNHPSSVEKAQTNIGLNTAGVGTASSTSHLHTLSPNSKKKNFTEELKSIPDLQCFRSMSSDLNNLTTSTSTVDIRIPLFDKKSSDFCFEKSREILSRPLTFGSQILASDNTSSVPPTLEEYKDSFASVDRGEDSRKKTLNENLFDIENTLKALNLDFMHTYTDLDKTDSDETILNDQFSSIVSSIDDEISSAAGSLKSTGVFNYNNGKNTTTTTFDFNAATTHLDKHLQYMKNAQANNQNVGTAAEKCCSTPDTGFASRDTISLSRRSSQKSSYSPQDSYFSPSACNGIACFPLPYKNGSQRYNSENVTSPFRGSQITPHENSTTSVYSPKQLKLEEDDSCNRGHSKLRLRSMSFTDNLNPVSESYKYDKRRDQCTKHSQSSDDATSHRRGQIYKPRSIKARTLRRLSYNPITAAATSSSSSSEEESVHSIDCSIARSECDIRSRALISLNKRRRQGMTRKLFDGPHHDDHEQIIGAPNKLYGSNVSIKSAPHYNYGLANTRSGFNSATSRFMYKQQTYDESLAYDERIYDFGGSGAVAVAKGPNQNINNSKSNATALFTTSKVLRSSGNSGSGSGSSSATSSAVAAYSGLNNSAFPEFDVSRLTGLSPTSNLANTLPETNRTPPSSLSLTQINSTMVGCNTEFQWPEKIHASTVKQNDLLWRQQQQLDYNAYNDYRSHPSSTLSSSTSDSEQFEYRSEYMPPRIPPSPAP
uniref:non-specific protein-tyrosine kinase n=1 Tax=Glossina pallidipes TaxID=7398 RepID=A0A1A9ZW58_GLOPL